MLVTHEIVKFMRQHYTDEKLAALLAHAEDGKLNYQSCCCFVGIVTAKGKLKTHYESQRRWYERHEDHSATHYWQARQLEGSDPAEMEYLLLGYDHYRPDGMETMDNRRRQRLIPLIKEEMARRDEIRARARMVEVMDYDLVEKG